MKRVDWDTFGMRLAVLAQSQSYDTKLRVGAAILSNDSHRIVSIGFNGRAPGEPHERESEEQGKSGFIHAEDNALLAASGRWFADETHTLYVTHAPCDMCARRIISMKKQINRIVFRHLYEDQWRRGKKMWQGLDMLINQNGIEVNGFEAPVAILFVPEI